MDLIELKLFRAYPPKGTSTPPKECVCNMNVISKCLSEICIEKRKCRQTDRQFMTRARQIVSFQEGSDVDDQDSHDDEEQVESRFDSPPMLTLSIKITALE